MGWRWELSLGGGPGLLGDSRDTCQLLLTSPTPHRPPAPGRVDATSGRPALLPAARAVAAKGRRPVPADPGARAGGPAGPAGPAAAAAAAPGMTPLLRAPCPGASGSRGPEALDSKILPENSLHLISNTQRPHNLVIPKLPLKL